MAGSLRKSSKRRAMSDINVVPYIDVMLVLLIIFMVTAPLLVSGVPVELPESRANALDQNKEPLEISINKDGGVFVDGDPVNDRDLAAKLEGIAATQSADDPRQIMLRGDRSIDYGQMMQVMGELNRAGLNSVSLVTTGSSKAE